MAQQHGNGRNGRDPRRTASAGGNMTIAVGASSVTRASATTCFGDRDGDDDRFMHRGHWDDSYERRSDRDDDRYEDERMRYFSPLPPPWTSATSRSASSVVAVASTVTTQNALSAGRIRRRARLRVRRRLRSRRRAHGPTFAIAPTSKTRVGTAIARKAGTAAKVPPTTCDPDARARADLRAAHR
jgi:hypothetical protein